MRSGYRRPGDLPLRESDAKPRDTRRLFVHDTFYKCWNSIWWYWHNETINIHTHLWGAVIAMIMLALQLADLHQWLPGGPWPILSLKHLPPKNTLERYGHLGLAIHEEIGRMHPSGSDLAALSIFLLAAMACLGCSATYHTVVCRSERTAQSFNRLD